jgi:precorrin-4/cobalt-precorrin-4 C11-methyltransferase
MPPGEDLATLGRSGATLAIHLSVTNLARVVRELAPLYGADCPALVAYRVGWPDQALLRGTLADIRGKVKAAGFTRTALILVGRVFGASTLTDSRLYAPDHHHVLRPRKPAEHVFPSSVPGSSRQSVAPRNKPPG